MSVKQIKTCPACGRSFIDNSEELYWHLRIHNAEVEYYLLKEQERRFYQKKWPLEGTGKPE